MKKGDLYWVLALAGVCAFLLMPATHEIFSVMTKNHPFIMGFIKFAILATMGELLAIRIGSGDWKIPSGLVARAAIWGFLGMVIVAIFKIFAGGVISVLDTGLIPGKGNSFVFAFLTSTFMNTTFAPTMMAFHRYTDTYIDMKSEGASDISVTAITNRIDWNSFVSFVVIKTIPMFWIPAHTVTFMLPAEYRVLAAAFLSIALGAILAFAKRKK